MWSWSCNMVIFMLSSQENQHENDSTDCKDAKTTGHIWTYVPKTVGAMNRPLVSWSSCSCLWELSSGCPGKLWNAWRRASNTDPWKYGVPIGSLNGTILYCKERWISSPFGQNRGAGLVYHHIQYHLPSWLKLKFSRKGYEVMLLWQDMARQAIQTAQIPELGLPGVSVRNPIPPTIWLTVRHGKSPT